MSLINVQYHIRESSMQSMIFQMTEIFLFSLYMKFKTLSPFITYKGQLFWNVLWMTFYVYSTLSSAQIFNVQFGVREGELEFYQDGDLIIGGMFTIHTSAMNDTENNTQILLCTDAYDQLPIDVLAFLSAIRNINHNPEILPNITLGFHVLDSCLHPSLAVRNVLSILSGPQKAIPNYSCSGEGQLVGFIGDHYSVTTIPMAQILGIYGYTEISYGATDYSLTNRLLYPHVFRMVQNDHVHYMAVIKLLKHFGWTWVGIIASEDDAGNKDKEILMKYMKNNGTSPRIYYAVEAMAKALHDMNLFCEGKLSDKEPHHYRHKLHQYLRKVKYAFGLNEPEPLFNLYGEFVYHYKITNWIHMDTYTVIYNDVGNFTSWAPEDQQLQINTNAITWKFGDEVPVSRCSGPCLPGTRKKFGSSVHECCYECVPCPEGEISNISELSVNEKICCTT